jgi:peptidoglycan/LPS O-acetylase OafA/YrhL
MKLAYHILTNVLGLGCIVACLAIVLSKGDVDIHWAGWIATAYFGVLALGIVAGWFPWRGRPLQVLIKGVYVMSALALIGFGFAMNDPVRVHLWMVLAGLGGAIVLRVILKVVFHLRDAGEDAVPLSPPAADEAPRKSSHDALFG